ncbi:hypothetical protein K502DRAFT_345016 [Neoconidiobolus thromboides FSU 785]|nr:hypothetical protein K502DRAFT_345016 [Neoconidiobolus thromboides FSU 785]
MIFDIGRAWHSSELINDKVVFFYGDINNSDSQYDIIAIDLKTLDLEKKTIKLSNTIGPATKKENEDFDQLYTSDEAMNYYVDPYKLKLTHYLNTSDIAGIIIGVILFTIILITLCYYFTNRYKKWKWYKKCNMLGSNPPSTFLSSLNLSLPNTKNGDEYGIWDLDSHYANSIHSLENELSHFNEPVILFRCNNSLPLSTRSTKINSSEETTASNIDSITDDTIINATSGF